MDKTPLKHIASVGNTWAKKRDKNVAVQRGLEKNQPTGNPWLNLNSDIVFFRTTIKDKK